MWGAAQTFGRFVERPFPTLLAERLGLPALNLGAGGAGPRHFDRPEYLDALNRAEAVVLQVLSGRSASCSLFDNSATGRIVGVTPLSQTPRALGGIPQAGGGGAEHKGICGRHRGDARRLCRVVSGAARKNQCAPNTVVVLQAHAGLCRGLRQPAARRPRRSSRNWSTRAWSARSRRIATFMWNACPQPGYRSPYGRPTAPSRARNCAETRWSTAIIPRRRCIVRPPICSKAHAAVLPAGAPVRLRRSASW